MPTDTTHFIDQQSSTCLVCQHTIDTHTERDTIVQLAITPDSAYCTTHIPLSTRIFVHARCLTRNACHDSCTSRLVPSKPNTVPIDYGNTSRRTTLSRRRL